MLATFTLTDYLERALTQAEYDKLEDGSFSGRIPVCKGVVAFGKTLRECEIESLHAGRLGFSRAQARTRAANCRMKRRVFSRHMREHGCELLREGGGHSSAFASGGESYIITA